MSDYPIFFYLFTKSHCAPPPPASKEKINISRNMLETCSTCRVCTYKYLSKSRSKDRPIAKRGRCARNDFFCPLSKREPDFWERWFSLTYRLGNDEFLLFAWSEEERKPIALQSCDRVSILRERLGAWLVNISHAQQNLWLWSTVPSLKQNTALFPHSQSDPALVPFRL